MMKSFVGFLSFAILMAPAGAGAQAQNAVNATGTWSVNSTGEPLANGTVRLRQDGPNVTGTYPGGGKIDGKFKPDGLQVDGTWSDPRGNGWMTIVFGADGNRFSGDWGRPGTRPSGHFEGSRAAYPAVTGTYHTTVSGSDAFATRRITLRQLDLDVVGNYGPGTQINGTMTSSNSFEGTWKGPNSNGWIKLQFADDSRSFQGTWGLTPGSEPAGSVTGSERNVPPNPAANNTTGQLDVRGLWHIASSGGAFGGDTLKLEQRGQSVSGSYKNGHLEGTVSTNSHSLSGNWRDSRGTGVFTISFASDGMSFHGTWSTKYNSGSLIGKRVIAATPALQQ